MTQFFVDNIKSDTFTLTGENAAHALHSLRMNIGEELILCDNDGIYHHAEITGTQKDSVTVKILHRFPCPNEPRIDITLFQALTKGDKMDNIIQKSVELGVSRIIPVITDRCISRPDIKSMDKKIKRWQKISKQAAMQSQRGKIPVIHPVADLSQAACMCHELDLSLVFYEKYGKNLKELVAPDIKSLGFFVGSEGGFEEKEIELLNSNNITCATLGNRILRTETAPLTALSIIMYITGNI